MQTGTPIGGKQLWIVVDFTLTYASINGARQRANVNLSFAALSLQPLFDRSRLQAILFFSFLSGSQSDHHHWHRNLSSSHPAATFMFACRCGAHQQPFVSLATRIHVLILEASRYRCPIVGSPVRQPRAQQTGPAAASRIYGPAPTSVPYVVPVASIDRILKSSSES